MDKFADKKLSQSEFRYSRYVAVLKAKITIVISYSLMINNIDGVLPEHELYFARFKFDPLLESIKLFKVEIVRKLTYSSLSAGLILDKEKLIKV